MKIIKYPLRSDWIELLKRPAFENVSLENMVSGVLSDVKKNGDAAIKKYTLQFDKVEIKNFVVTEKEFIESEHEVPDE